MSRIKRLTNQSILRRSARGLLPPGQCRSVLHLERLEDRFLMDGAGFVQTDPDADPDSVVGEAGIEAVDDYVKVEVGTELLRIDVLSNDPLPDGTESLRIKSISQTARGAEVTISDDGRRVIYQPPEGGITFDHFYYLVEDDQGQLGKANVTIGVKPNPSDIYRPPLLTSNDRFYVLEDSDERELDVLRNDRDFREGEIIAVASANLGTVRIAEDGKSLFYQPTFAQSGRDHFQYTVRRDDGETATASVSVNVDKPYGIARDCLAKLSHLWCRRRALILWHIDLP